MGLSGNSVLGVRRRSTSPSELKPPFLGILVKGKKKKVQPSTANEGGSRPAHEGKHQTPHGKVQKKICLAAVTRKLRRSFSRRSAQGPGHRPGFGPCRLSSERTSAASSPMTSQE